MKRPLLITLTGLTVLLTCCTEMSLDYRGDEGRVLISPDWGSYTVPGSAACFFYPFSQGSNPLRYDAVDATLFNQALPTGHYQLLGWNTDASGIEFGNLDDRSRAEARMSGGVPPGILYSWHAEDLAVPYRDTLRVQPPVQALVKTLTFHFRMSESEEVVTLEGKLYGVYPSVLLLTGEPSASSSAAASGTSVAFTVTLGTPSRSSSNATLEGSVSVRLLGLLDPKNGLAYDNRLELVLHSSGGTTRSGEVSMNGVLSAILKANGDQLPSEVPVEITVDIQWINSVLVALVTSWKNGEGGGNV